MSLASDARGVRVAGSIGICTLAGDAAGRARLLGENLRPAANGTEQKRSSHRY